MGSSVIYLIFHCQISFECCKLSGFEILWSGHRIPNVLSFPSLTSGFGSHTPLEELASHMVGRFSPYCSPSMPYVISPRFLPGKACLANWSDKMFVFCSFLIQRVGCSRLPGATGTNADFGTSNSDPETGFPISRNLPSPQELTHALGHPLPPPLPLAPTAWRVLLDATSAAVRQERRNNYVQLATVDAADNAPFHTWSRSPPHRWPTA